MCLGLPAKVVTITDPAKKLGLVELDGGEQREVNLACVIGEEGIDGAVGAWVLLHLGFAMQRITEAEASTCRQVLSEIAALTAETS